MITLIEGRIGSGKTYFAVQDVLNKYYRYDNDKVQWVLNCELDIEIYTNIEGFWVAKDLDEVIKKAGGLEAFFSESYQKKFTKLKKHVYVIDEAQKSSLFHKKFYNTDVFYVFEFSRHLGIDFVLITQDLWKLSPGLVNLPEIHIKAQRRSMSLFKNIFIYMYMSDKDILKKKYFRLDPRIFAAYRSQRVCEIMNIKIFSRRFVVMILILVVILSCSFYAFIKCFRLLFSGDKVVAVSKTEEKIVAKKYVGVVGDYIFYQEGFRLIKEKVVPALPVVP